MKDIDHDSDMSFRLFLSTVVAAALPKTVDSTGLVVPNRCHVHFEALCEMIQEEAYNSGTLSPNSMFNAIHGALAEEIARINAKFEQDFSLRKDNPDYKMFQECLTKVHVPHMLPAEYSELVSPLSQYTNNPRRWYEWLRGKAIPSRKVYEVILISIYGILSYQREENSLEHNERILLFYKSIIGDGIDLPDDVSSKIIDSRAFSWVKDASAPPTLSVFARGLICTTFLLFGMHLCCDSKKENLKEIKTALLKRVLQNISDENKQELFYFNEFRKTQSAQVFLAQPFSLPEERKTPLDGEFIPPKSMPWSDLSTLAPIRVRIEAPPAGGKTMLYRNLGAALVRNSLPKSKMDAANALAQQLKVGAASGWIVIGLNAQQYLWYREEYGSDRCGNFVEMFFRGNMIHNEVEPNLADAAMQAIIPNTLRNAEHRYRLVFMFDGYDELINTGVQADFKEALNTFLNSYPSAHVLIFTRPIHKEDRAWFNRYNFQTHTIPPQDNTQRGIFVRASSKDLSYDRYADAAANPLMLRLLLKENSNSLFTLACDFLHQVIMKEYDCQGRRMYLPCNIDKEDMFRILAQIAWNTLLNPRFSIMQHLGKVLGGDTESPDTGSSISEKEKLIHTFACQTGILEYMVECADYRFTAPHVQAVLAVSHILRILKLNVDPNGIRYALRQLPDGQFEDIGFALVHAQQYMDATVAEMMFIDYLSRVQEGPMTGNHILQDMQAIQGGIYGETVIQRDRIGTCSWLFDVTQAKLNLHSKICSTL